MHVGGLGALSLEPLSSESELARSFRYVWFANYNSSLRNMCIQSGSWLNWIRVHKACALEWVLSLEWVLLCWCCWSVSLCLIIYWLVFGATNRQLPHKGREQHRDTKIQSDIPSKLKEQDRTGFQIHTVGLRKYGTLI